MIQATLCFAIQGDPPERVLLGLKKGGFGAGKFDGFGGKVELGEAISAAAARELQEESGIQVHPDDLRYVAGLDFAFPSKPEWSQVVHAFVASRWSGTPAESDEMVPEWFDVAAIPYNRMWDDSSFWLPRVLLGSTVMGRFVFGPDNARVAQVRLEAVPDGAPPEVVATLLRDGIKSTLEDRLLAINEGLRRRFGGVDEPFAIMTRLLEECGELAQQVNHFEGAGVKHEKLGEPDKAHLAKEVQDVLRCSLQIAQHYHIVDQLQASVRRSFERMVSEGWIPSSR